MSHRLPLWCCLAALSACGGGQGQGGLKSLSVGGVELDIESGRTFFSVSELDLGLRSRVVAKPADRQAEVRLRWETAAGGLIEANAGKTLPLLGDQRLVVELTEVDGSTERWMVAITPWDLVPITQEGEPSELFTFLTPRDYTLAEGASGFSPFLLVVDGHGTPVWWRRTDIAAFDFRVSESGLFTVNTALDGQPGAHSNVVDPTGGEVLESWKPELPDGWDTARTDVHELVLRDDGALVQTVTGTGTEDLRPWGGAINGSVWHSMVRELDGQGGLVGEWSTWGEVDLDALPPEVLASEADPGAWRFGHINSVQADAEGWLLSLRSPNQVVKVDRATQQVLWRVGGSGSDVVFVGDERDGFYGQHSARMFDPNRLTVFDNGTNMESPATGDVRVVEYALDFDAGTATLQWQYALEGAGGTAYAGLVQRLADGRTLIGWGSTQLQGEERSPSITLLDADHQPLSHLRLPLNTYTYRAYAFEGDPFSGEWRGPDLSVMPR